MSHDIVQMFREKLDSFTISDYHGLDSPGLTCYLNSVLQVLFMTEDFREALKRCCSEDSTSIDTVLERLFADLQKSVAKTHHVIKKLGITNVYEQRDAAEYFEKILCLTSPEAAKIFKGELNHKIRCLKCNEKNDSRSFFWILPLVVEDLPRQTYSVEKGLKAFFKGEKVCGDNKMFCNHCNEKQDADFGCEITHNPETLTLLLKRFSYSYKHRCFVKLHCSVDVPQTLHVKNCKYALYALVNHFGNLTGGHYTAHIKSFETYVWYHFNDDIVNRVEQPLFGAGDKSLKSHTAYLLMYRKVSRHPETTYEGDQEALCAHSDVKAEGGNAKTERGEPAVPHQLKDESGITGKNLMPLNGDILKTYDDMDWKKQTNLSEELDKQSNQEAACTRQRKEVLKTNTGADRDRIQTQTSNFAKLQKDGGLKLREPIRQQRSTNSEEHLRHLDTKTTPTKALRTHQLDCMLEQNHTSPNDKLKGNKTVNIVAKTGTSKSFKPAETKTVTIKREAVAVEGKTAKHKREADVGPNMCDSDVKLFYISSNGSLSSSAQYSTGHFQGQRRKNEPTGCSCSPNLCRKSNNSERDKDKVQHAVTAESCCKPETKQSVKKGEIPAGPRESPRKRRAAVERRDKAKQEPWSKEGGRCPDTSFKMVVKIVVNGPGMDEMTVDLCDTEEQLQSMTVLQLKKKITERQSDSGGPGLGEDLQLVFKDKDLAEDSTLLSEYGIQHMSVIQVGQRVKVVLRKFEQPDAVWRRKAELVLCGQAGETCGLGEVADMRTVCGADTDSTVCEDDVDDKKDKRKSIERLSDM